MPPPRPPVVEPGRDGDEGITRDPRRRAAGGRRSMNSRFGQFLTRGAILFSLAVTGIFLNRRNLIVLLMAIELLLLSVNFNFVAFSRYLGDIARPGVRVLRADGGRR